MTDKMVDDVLALVADTNDKAAQARRIDPLFELSCRAEVREDESAIDLTVTRSSGGGEESAYVIEDRALVVVGADGKAHLSLRPGEGMMEELEGMEWEQVLERIRGLCRRAIPEPGDTI